ncbi:hypothetical protein SeMB42_g01020 [Synchytrium endobioticum]|uniref:Uncharacterized protein n=1 Tax=Synchytrium endobioticum TaxID=286115 RepID=A0A507DMX9_9FUNG|nr:hypothetical protein SeLEV6574_g00475 [Synchytrium endobioticum]TPX53069.1 hypothetical protein SeMB42_g01020 [Synchytrium endobioticum]
MDGLESRKRFLDDARIDQYRLVRPRTSGGGIEVLRSAAAPSFQLSVTTTKVHGLTNVIPGPVMDSALRQSPASVPPLGSSSSSVCGTLASGTSPAPIITPATGNIDDQMLLLCAQIEAKIDGMTSDCLKRLDTLETRVVLFEKAIAQANEGGDKGGNADASSHCKEAQSSAIPMSGMSSQVNHDYRLPIKLPKKMEPRNPSKSGSSRAGSKDKSKEASIPRKKKHRRRVETTTDEDDTDSKDSADGRTPRTSRPPERGIKPKEEDQPFNHAGSVTADAQNKKVATLSTESSHSDYGATDDSDYESDSELSIEIGKGEVNSVNSSWTTAKTAQKIMTKSNDDSESNRIRKVSSHQQSSESPLPTPPPQPASARLAQPNPKISTTDVAPAAEGGTERSDSTPFESALRKYLFLKALFPEDNSVYELASLEAYGDRKAYEKRVKPEVLSAKLAKLRSQMKIRIHCNLKEIVGRRTTDGASLEAVCKDLFSNSLHIHDRDKKYRSPILARAMKILFKDTRYTSQWGLNSYNISMIAFTISILNFFIESPDNTGVYTKGKKRYLVALEGLKLLKRKHAHSYRLAVDFLWEFTS